MYIVSVKEIYRYYGGNIMLTIHDCSHLLLAGGMLFLMISAVGCGSEKTLPYLDTSLSVDERVNDLVSRMTLEEKVSQMLNSSPAIERLDVPTYNWWNECLHGVARAGRATVFPQAIGLAAMWDSGHMNRVATAISDEARAKHHDFVKKGKRGIYQGLTFWTPNINIFRDPRWGRGMETYGEDPFLTGTMSVAFIKGIQGDDPKYLKAVATAKHYAVHSGPEWNRHTFDAVTDERDLRETYLPHFKMAIEEGGAFSVMGAYNRYLGEACCGSSLLLNDILRKEWGFDGYVVSDCGAIHDIFANHKVVETPEEAAALAVKSGCELNCGEVYEHLVEAVKQGHISEDEIDIAVKRLFEARFKLGMFDPDDMVDYANIPYSVIDCDEHRSLALETAHKSIVLLKNDDGLLPLKKDAGTIAVIGPNANDVEVLLGNYNGIPTEPITPLAGITHKVSGQSEVIHAFGCEWAENLPNFGVVPAEVLFHEEDGELKPGLKGDYFKNAKFEGEPAFTQVDPEINFNWWEGAPGEDFNDDNFSIRWKGVIVPKVSGTYSLGAYGSSGFSLFVDGEPLVRYQNPHEPRAAYETVEFEAGKRYELQIDYYELFGIANIDLLWSLGGRDYRSEALAAAKKADTVIMVMGLSPRLEGEEMKVKVDGFRGGDRIRLDLPDIQQKLMKDIVALGKPTVLVMLNGSAVAINWASENIPAIVEAWYPGQAAGTAIADVLFGDYNPAGRLPVTFYKSPDQLPPFEEYAMKGSTYRYFEGEPLYPFGYGLSYTTFSYGNLVMPEKVTAGENAEIKADVTNSGAVAGEEVVQLYISDREADVPVPIRSLKGFQRISLAPGETKTVTFTLDAEDMSLIDASYKRVVDPGVFEIAVGGKQPGFKGHADAETTSVVSGSFEVTGDVFSVE